MYEKIISVGQTWIEILPLAFTAVPRRAGPSPFARDLARDERVPTGLVLSLVEGLMCNVARLLFPSSYLLSGTCVMCMFLYRSSNPYSTHLS